MKLTPLDIRKQEFNRAWRGFDPEEVEAFLQMMAGQWHELLEEKRRLEEKMRERDFKLNHYEKVEEALEEALKTGRETARQTIENAERRAEVLIVEAEKRAEDIKREAETDRHQIKREAAKISGRRNEIVARLRAFLLSEMELLARFEGDDPTGFIKLLPAEQRSLHNTLARISHPDIAAAALDEAVAEFFAPEPTMDPPDGPAPDGPTPDGPTPDGPTPDAPADEDAAELEARSVADLIGNGLEDFFIDEERPAPAADQKPAGWVVRSYVPPEDAAEQDPDTASEKNSLLGSQEEMNRIRRILDDLE